MKTRIQIKKKYNGTEEYIPQYRIFPFIWKTLQRREYNERFYESYSVDASFSDLKSAVDYIKKVLGPKTERTEYINM